MIISAVIFGILIFLIILFQAALALGKPWGEYAMAGKFPGKFPPALRAAAVVQIFILIFIGLIVLTKAGLILPEYYSFAAGAIWFVVIFSLISSVLNTITPSKKERSIWAPVSAVLLITSLIVALS